MQQDIEAKKDNKKDNKKDIKENNLDTNNQELDILYQLSFEEYMQKTNEKPRCFGCCSCCKDCCCCCCCCCSCCRFCCIGYNLWCEWPYDHIEKFYKNVQKYKKCNDNSISFFSILTLFFNIIALCLSFHLNPVLKDLKNKNSRRLGDDDDIDPSRINDFDFDEANIHPKYDLWYTLSKMEIGILIINTIIFILFIIFDFLMKYKYYDIIIEREKKIGKITNTIILIICIFYVLFALIFFFTVYLFAYSNFICYSLNMKLYDSFLCYVKVRFYCLYLAIFILSFITLNFYYLYILI